MEVEKFIFQFFFFFEGGEGERGRGEGERGRGEGVYEKPIYSGELPKGGGGLDSLQI